MIPFADEAEAVRLANDTIYGLSGSIWTRDGARALRVARAIETGVISINSNTSVRVTTPFGGFKQSGYGRELGPHALEAYTEVKTIFYATEGDEPMPAGSREGVRGHGRAAGSARRRRVFQREGARVVGADLSAGAPGDMSLKVDVTDEQQVAAIIRARSRSSGASTCSFNNAGISPTDDGSVLDTTLAAWERVQEVNLRSVFLCCKHGIPHLLGAAADRSSTRRRSSR